MGQLNRFFCGLLCATVMAAVGGSAVHASTPAPAVTGGFSVFPVAAATAPVQLLTGTDGRLWFVTAQSQLGLISSTGQITLLPVTVPHGTGTATLVGAGPEGVWAYGNTTGTTPSCTVSLTTTGGVVTQQTQSHPAASLCYGGARDASGNGWFSIHGAQTGSGVSRMVRLSQVGQPTTVLPDRAGARPGAVALGSDGAIWALEFNNHSYGRYTATAPATTVAIGGSETPPYPGSIFFGVNPRQLLPRADGTFWLLGFNVILSDPGKWSVRYLFDGRDVGATTPDGALWSVFSDRTGPPAERLARMDVTGRFDRSATLASGDIGRADDGDRSDRGDARRLDLDRDQRRHQYVRAAVSAHRAHPRVDLDRCRWRRPLVNPRQLAGQHPAGVRRRGGDADRVDVDRRFGWTHF